MAICEGRGILSSPAVETGTVFIGSMDRNLYALDVATGQECWRFTTGVTLSSSPAVADGVVYFGSHDGYIYTIESGNNP